MTSTNRRSLRIAYFSPLPPTRSGIADYSMELLPHLAQHAKVRLFVDEPQRVTPELREAFEILPVDSYATERWDFDLALYHMGNSVHHETIYKTALRFPGIVVLHDHGLHHFLAAITGSDKKYSAYVRDMGYALGQDGVDLAWRVRYGRQPYPFFELPMNERLIDRSLGLIVHSQAVAGMIAARRPDRPVRAIRQQMAIRAANPRREKLNLPAETIIFASTGQITVAKRLDLALRAFARLLPSYPNAAFLIVGEVVEEVDLSGLISQLGLEDKVHTLGFAPDLQDFVDWTATADVIVNLRYPTIGETSASALRALATGRPLIVFDLGSYSELPDEICLKVPPMDEDELLQAMSQLADDPDRRGQMGRQALSYVKQFHDPSQIARQYVDFMHDLLAEINQQFGRRG